GAGTNRRLERRAQLGDHRLAHHGSVCTGAARALSHSTCTSTNAKVRALVPMSLKYTQVCSLAYLMTTRLSAPSSAQKAAQAPFRRRHSGPVRRSCDSKAGASIRSARVRAPIQKLPRNMRLMSQKKMVTFHWM